MKKDNIFRLDELNINKMKQDWGLPGKNESVKNTPLSIKGKKYDYGVGFQGYTEFTIDLKNNALKFEAEIGIDDCTKKGSFVVYSIYGDLNDKNRIWRLFKHGEKPKKISMDIKNTRYLDIVINRWWHSSTDFNPANLCNAKITLKNPKIKPEIAFLEKKAPYILTPTVSDEPKINYPRIVGAGTGKELLYTIPTSGKRPMRFTIKGLPDGLCLGEKSGIISGHVKKKGIYKVKVTAINKRGKDTQEIKIVIGKGIALTPPLGWNSWNVWGTSVNDKKIRDTGDVFIKKELAQHGWSFINIDDGWEKGRDKKGGIVVNEKFPDMKKLCNYIHTLGLKIGIYSSPGPKTCGGYEGSYKHEMQDALSYAQWGIDYLKYDWCSCKSRDLKAPYTLMKKCLEKSNRDIVYSLCQYGMGNVWEWGAQAGGNCWRTTGDIEDTWHSMAGIGFNQIPQQKYGGPTHWNDPDMMVLGYVGWGPNVRPCRLNPDEQYTHMTLWTLLCSPLLLGCDLTKLDRFTLNLITNDEILGVSQDELGKQARRIYNEDLLQIWKKPMADGSTVYGFFNLTCEDMKNKKITLPALGSKGSKKVRDLWRQENKGIDKGYISLNIPAHVCQLYKFI